MGCRIPDLSLLGNGPIKGESDKRSRGKLRSSCGSVLVQRELDNHLTFISNFRQPDAACTSPEALYQPPEFSLGMGEALNIDQPAFARQVGERSDPPVRCSSPPGRLFLASCASTELASVSPTTASFSSFFRSVSFLFQRRALRASRTADSFRPRSAMMASVLPSSLSFGATQPMALCNRKSL